MDISIQTQQIVEAVKNIENKGFNQENVNFLINQDTKTGNEYVVIWYRKK